jgi:dipeptidyl aminopeptidase/acylaminoacyl peptidase
MLHYHRHFIAFWAPSIILSFLPWGCREGTVGPSDRPALVPANEILYASRTMVETDEIAYSMKPDGSGIRKRIRSPASSPIGIVAAVWSPDMTMFAVVWSFSDQSRQEYPVMWLVDSAGVFITQVADTAAESPVWSPDGSQIAYTCNGIDVVNVRSGSRKRISAGIDTVYAVYDWSIDGQRLLSGVAMIDSRRVIQKEELWEIDLDGKLKRRIFSRDSILVTFAQWSPDEDEVAVIFLRLGDYYSTRATGIWLMQSNGSSIQAFAPELRTWGDHASYGTGDGLRWSPDGQEIGYSIQTEKGGSFFWSKTIIATKNGQVVRVLFTDSLSTHRICDWR